MQLFFYIFIFTPTYNGIERILNGCACNDEQKSGSGSGMSRELMAVRPPLNHLMKLLYRSKSVCNSFPDTRIQ
ncbi:uncharacterized protein M6B38_314750 [Iris pallida]|uniref:Uncharacterized protein n=1 Tax=Iris pallida TaxID=29817 RepID=A0AAX6HFX4_IRIPA|nr:uncharacterized protein M6B38_314750 [Iris pallida]